MAQFSEIMLAYFLIGAVMWGGGVIAWDSAGLGTLFIDQPTNGTEVNNETASQLEDVGGPIQQAAETIGGGAVLAVWNLLTAFLNFLFWPTTVLIAVGAPPRAVVIGTSLTVMFFGGIFRLIRSSA